MFACSVERTWALAGNNTKSAPPRHLPLPPPPDTHHAPLSFPQQTSDCPPTSAIESRCSLNRSASAWVDSKAACNSSISSSCSPQSNKTPRKHPHIHPSMQCNGMLRMRSAAFFVCGLIFGAMERVQGDCHWGGEGKGKLCSKALGCSRRACAQCAGEAGAAASMVRVGSVQHTAVSHWSSS